MSAMDKSLDEIIATNPKGTRKARRGGGARAQILGKPVTSPTVKAKVAPPRPSSASPQTSTKIIVSNLPPDVTEPQVKELFSQTVGPLRDVTLNYDAQGRSKGVATITFNKPGDANKAYTQYNNRLIDGKRAMKIEIVVDPTRPLSLASRVSPAPAQAAAAPRGGAAGRGRRGNVRGRGRGGRRERVPKSAADLDAEMEDYTGTDGPAPVAVAAAAPAAAAT